MMVAVWIRRTVVFRRQDMRTGLRQDKKDKEVGKEDETVRQRDK